MLFLRVHGINGVDHQPLKLDCWAHLPIPQTDRVKLPKSATGEQGKDHFKSGMLHGATRSQFRSWWTPKIMHDPEFQRFNRISLIYAPPGSYVKLEQQVIFHHDRVLVVCQLSVKAAIWLTRRRGKASSHLRREARKGLLWTI